MNTCFDVSIITGLVVSCQARGRSPVAGPIIMSAMAAAAAGAGATAIRANGRADVAAIRAAVDVPIIGIKKVEPRGPDLVYITPDVEAVDEVISAGAEVVALDGTARHRPGGTHLQAVVEHAHSRGAAVMADIDTVDSARYARNAGVDLVATTLSGYTTQTVGVSPGGPDLRLVADLANAGVPVVAEGRYRTPELARAALELGAQAVVVGTAITNPGAITESFIRALAPWRN